MTSNLSTLQRISEIQEKHPDIFLEQSILQAKQQFQIILDVPNDSFVGRGHHESYHVFLPTGQIICFLWDEDHDERLYLAAQNLLNSLSENGKRLILLLGERKANLTIVTTNDNAKKSILASIGADIDCFGDIWNVQVSSSSNEEISHSGIIHDNAEITSNYIQNLLSTREAISHVWTNLELRNLEARVRNNKKS